LQLNIPVNLYVSTLWQLLDIGSLTADGNIMLSTGPLSMTVDAESLAPVTSTDADIINAAASSAAMAMTVGRHLTNKWPLTATVMSCAQWTSVHYQPCSSDDDVRFAAFWFFVDSLRRSCRKRKCRVGKRGTRFATFSIFVVSGDHSCGIRNCRIGKLGPKVAIFS